MVRNGKSNTFLLGQIYERTEVLPEMRKNIEEIKQKQIVAFYERDNLKKRVRKIERTSISCLTRRAGRIIFNLLLGRIPKP